jgi:hypothetical protein
MAGSCGCARLELWPCRHGCRARHVAWRVCSSAPDTSGCLRSRSFPFVIYLSIAMQQGKAASFNSTRFSLPCLIWTSCSLFVILVLVHTGATCRFHMRTTARTGHVRNYVNLAPKQQQQQPSLLVPSKLG